ncbi:unnamed protein product [Calypogeia fissa]
MEKVKALFQQTHKKGVEFAYEGAWKILKDSPKWQIAARLNEKLVDRAAKRKKNKSIVGASSADGGSAVAEVEEESPEKESATPKMVTKRPLGNKKAKELAAIERKSHKHKNALAESKFEIAAALNRRARAMESVFEIQLFSIDLGSLDDKARQFMLLNREVAELELHKQLKSVEPLRKETVSLPRTLMEQENIGSNAINVEDIGSAKVEQESGEDCEDIADYDTNQANPIDLDAVPEPEQDAKNYECLPGFSDNVIDGSFQYNDVQALYRFM